MAQVKSTSSLEGFDALKRAFAKAPESVQRHAADVIEKSAFAVAQRMRSLVPVRTGKLKSRIASTATGLNGRVGFSDRDAFYWKFVEYGTVRMPARPFVRPAAEAESEPYIRAMSAIGPKLERDMSAGSLL
jgi:HK97 gp10 family phage protein